MTVDKFTKASIAKNVHQILNIYGHSEKKIYDILETLIELIKYSLERGNDVMISGFGKFSVKEKKARKGRNPATGEDMMLPPRRVVTFKWSGKLRDKVNSGK